MPIATIIEFLLKYWQYVGMGILILIITILKLDVSHLHNVIDSDKITIQHFVETNKALVKQINDQNDSITLLKKTGDEYKAKLDQAQLEADKQRASYAQQLFDMKKKITPKDCDGAMQRLLDDAVSHNGGHL